MAAADLAVAIAILNCLYSSFLLRLSSCRLTGAFVISPLPPILLKDSCAVGSLRSMGVTPLHHYYGPSRHRLVFGRFHGVSTYTAYLAPPISRWDEDGFSSCSVCPCHRAAPTTPPEWPAAAVRLPTDHAAFTREEWARPPVHIFFEATSGFTCVAAR